MGVYYRGCKGGTGTGAGQTLHQDLTMPRGRVPRVLGSQTWLQKAGRLANEGLGFRGYSGIMEKKMETTIVFRV